MEFTFKYQEFISEQHIDETELPEHLKEMIQNTNRQITKAKEKCTEGDCSIVTEKLKPYADFIFEQLKQLFGDENENVDSLIEEPEKEPPVLSDTEHDEAILDKITNNGVWALEWSELRERGLISPIPMLEKYVEIGKYYLQRTMMGTLWLIRLLNPDL